MVNEDSFIKLNNCSPSDDRQFFLSDSNIIFTCKQIRHEYLENLKVAPRSWDCGYALEIRVTDFDFQPVAANLAQLLAPYFESPHLYLERPFVGLTIWPMSTGAVPADVLESRVFAWLDQCEIFRYMTGYSYARGSIESLDAEEHAVRRWLGVHVVGGEEGAQVRFRADWRAAGHDEALRRYLDVPKGGGVENARGILDALRRHETFQDDESSSSDRGTDEDRYSTADEDDVDPMDDEEDVDSIDEDGAAIAGEEEASSTDEEGPSSMDEAE